MAEGVGGRRSMKEFSGRGGSGLKCCLCEEEEMLEIFREAEPSRGEDPPHLPVFQSGQELWEG